MIISLQILLALIIDQLLGDPRWLPHPVKLIALTGNWLEKKLRAGALTLPTAGLLTIILMMVISATATWLLIAVGRAIHPLLGWISTIIILWLSFAARDLWRHSHDVYLALKDGNLEESRRRVGQIVGRDTTNLNEEEVARAAVESVAESLVDGVTAPLFYAFIGGPMGAMLYKCINTGDSMFGYKNEEYMDFGRWPARLDDIANFIPARLTALLIPVAALVLGLNGRKSWQILVRDRKNHASPNSGHSEAAMAGALDIQLGGASAFAGKIIHKPTMGDKNGKISPQHIMAANRLMLCTTILCFILLATFFPML